MDIATKRWRTIQIAVHRFGHRTQTLASVSKCLKKNIQHEQAIADCHIHITDECLERLQSYRLSDIAWCVRQARTRSWYSIGHVYYMLDLCDNVCYLNPGRFNRVIDGESKLGLDRLMAFYIAERYATRLYIIEEPEPLYWPRAVG